MMANLTPVGIYDIFFAKYDSNGNYLWAKSIGSTSDDISESIALDASGNAFIIGFFQGTADFDPSAGTANLTPVGNIDIFFAKYDSNGNYLWAKSIGSTSDDFGNSIALDAGGNAFITGEFNGTADFDPSAGTANLTSVGGRDIFFAKYAPPPPLTISLSSTNVTCNGSSNGSATATPGGGVTPYSYLWSNGATTSSVSGLPSSVYSVTVTDANSATAINSVTVSQPSAINLSVNTTNASCNGGSDGTATAITGGGTGSYSYLWSDGQTTSTATGLSIGAYTVTVTDANACTATGNASVTQPNCSKVRTADCGITLSDLNQAIYCDPVSGATNWEWEWVHAASGFSKTVLRN
ncbi:MAG: SprB repeat-containing protein, partial [Bacteroidetes bacterium]|nr:SprB repeat-containing protein [Bacteroidota bacterium]